MNTSFKASAVLILISLSLSSCKLNQQIENNNPAMKGIGGMDPGKERNYTASELQISRRICANLKMKRDTFEKYDNGKVVYRFRAELRNCDNGVYNADLFEAAISNANSTEPEYIASRENYFKDVVTDQSGIMKQVCDAVIQSDKVQNAILNGNFKYSVNFLIVNGYDRYEVIKSKKDSTGGYNPLSGEAVSIISQKIQAPTEFLGVEKERIRYTMCDSTRYSTTKQTWIEKRNF